MSLTMLTTGIAILCVAVAMAVAIHTIAVHVADKLLRGRRKSYGKVRSQLYEHVYGLKWGGVTTNNYGFAPAEGDGRERFQLQMYKELYKLLDASGRLQPHTDLLEVSCGRGGGLVHLLQAWPSSSWAVGLDYSAKALQFCKQTHGHIANLAFVRGSALQLPFADETFDVVLNVEASNDYGDHRAFYREVCRVLRPGGVFLYSDTRRPKFVAAIEQAMRETALDGEFREITSHVAEACRLDSDRRRRLIRDGVPWYYRILFGKQLANYAAIEGTRKFEEFRNSRRLYFMTCAIKRDFPSSHRSDAVAVASPQDNEDNCLKSHDNS
jgi:ubiquinone/menaquinone biosynthesis C-methylase UbiE